MNRKTIKTGLQKAIKLHQEYTLKVEKIEKKLGGEITCVMGDYAELVYKKEWYSIDIDRKLKRHEINGGK